MYTSALQIRRQIRRELRLLVCGERSAIVREQVRRSEDRVEIARMTGVVSEKTADLVFGSDHEDRPEDTLSRVEGNFLVQL